MQSHLSTEIKDSPCNWPFYKNNRDQSSISPTLKQTPACAGVTHSNCAVPGLHPNSRVLMNQPRLVSGFAIAMIVITLISAGNLALAEQIAMPPLSRANQYPGMSTPFHPGSNSNGGIINHPAYPGTVTNPGNTGSSGNPAYPGTSNGSGNSGPVYPGTGGNPGYPGNPTTPTPPSNPGAISDYNLYNYGHTKYAAGNLNSAYIYFDQLVKQYPGSQYADDADFWRAKIRAEQKNHQQAIFLFANFLRVWPTSDYYAEALYTLAETEKAFGRINYANRNHLFESAGHFAGYQQRYPQSPKASEALFQAGECFEISGDYNSSRSYYYRVTQIYPYSAAAAKAREKLSGRY